ncbi:PTS transporter subunit EIIC [Corynebacterium aquilae]|uniref:PTS N-acetylglucosamine transporter subunit IIBC n=1 Tax=Corynebacterium aquilae DSM 44791 TaxID=1431546 RepID=A0A1L7CGM2_9CORY|nr:PTS transporter subunit EIIC [Corynebacterium aquilae]APT84903.1 PTS N-acetylglucosamine transporter subunit IIBC [Corynebacterium aquilae DSM 44791]
MSAQDTSRNRVLIYSQRLGRSLMLPIASLPVAGLLLRLGQDDMLGRWADSNTFMAWVSTIFSSAGGALFENLPLLFAVGVAIGWAKKADGSTALAGVVGYVVLSNIFKGMSPFVLGEDSEKTINYGVLAGLVAGLIAAMLWQRYHRTRLPDWLGFFNGRRFVPIITGFTMVLVSIPMLVIYPAFNSALNALSEWMVRYSEAGGFLFGVINRLLIPVGLHHLLNFTPWFMLGEFTGENGETVTGDISRFLAQDPTAGTFMTGFFPIMMFGLPAAALAITRAARPEMRKYVGGGMVSLALTAFLTGITEPIEFAFMFVAWPLYVVHAILTGTSLAVCNALGIHDGFLFSAGALDYLLNFGIATKPLLLLVVGAAYFVIYYFVFYFMITKLDLKTPGRNPEEDQKMMEELTKA